jgi:hypothetical protein
VLSVIVGLLALIVLAAWAAALAQARRRAPGRTVIRLAVSSDLHFMSDGAWCRYDTRQAGRRSCPESGIAADEFISGSLYACCARATGDPSRCRADLGADGHHASEARLLGLPSC